VNTCLGRLRGSGRAGLISLVLAQIATTAVAGAVIGTIIFTAAIGVSGDSFPSVTLFAVVDIVAVGLARIAAVAPAIAASRRDPITELRVP